MGDYCWHLRPCPISRSRSSRSRSALPARQRQKSPPSHHVSSQDRPESCAGQPGIYAVDRRRALVRPSVTSYLSAQRACRVTIARCMAHISITRPLAQLIFIRAPIRHHRIFRTDCNPPSHLVWAAICILGPRPLSGLFPICFIFISKITN